MPIQQALLHEPPAATTVVGQQEYTSPGSYSWTCPSEVNEVHVVCIGGGGGGQTQDFKAGGGGGGRDRKREAALSRRAAGVSGPAP